MLEDFRLRVFVTVAQAGSFTMAAVQLGITKPAVSQHISELEKNYGVRLFDRLRGAIVLTPSGELFYEHAVEILQQYSDLHQMLQRFPERIVRVSASEDVFHYLVTTVLDRFQKVHPEIGFQHSFLQEADLRVSLEASPTEKGTIRLSYHPSSSFASTRLWSVLSKVLQPALK
jgi:DNA-binding transcriptional LysR family regulator